MNQPNFNEEDFEQPTSLGSSQGYEADQFELYGVTPPQNMRAQKRSKERYKSRKKKEEKVVFAFEKIIRNSSSKEQISTFDDVTIKIDNVVDSPVTKKRSSKSFKHSRFYERDYKVASNEPDGDGNQLHAPQTYIKIDSPNRYLSLNSKHVSTASGDDASPVDDTLFKRDLVDSQAECPKDRIDFFKDFSRVVNMSNCARKEKKESKHSPMARQMSSEQELWQNQVNDLIWLELQAVRSNRTMEEQDSYLSQAQRQIDDVLQEITNFRVKLPDRLCLDLNSKNTDRPNSSSSNTKFAPEVEENLVVNLPTDKQKEIVIRVEPCDANADTSNDVFKKDSTDAYHYDNTNAPCFPENLHTSVEAQKEALSQVLDIFTQLESVEKLYPTTKALGKAHPLYNSEEFQRKIRILCTWTNACKDLAHKLHLMAKILSIDQIEGIDWPWMKYDCQDKLLHRIRNPDDVITPMVDEEEDYESDDKEDYLGNGDQSPAPADVGNSRSKVTAHAEGNTESSKMVQFDPNTSPALSPLNTSTPSKSPENRGVLFPRMPSCMSIEELTALSLYHYFADRMLKKTGLRKMMERLQKVLHKTLARAKEGLEKPPEPLSYAEVTSQGKEVIL